MAPTFTGEDIELRRPGFSAKDWKRTNDLKNEISGGKAVDVKYTLPGPMTIMDGLNYKPEDEAKIRRQLVAAINREMVLLADEGCRVIQVCMHMKSITCNSLLFTVR